MKSSRLKQDKTTPSPNGQNGVRRTLLSGVFWRILLIEAILLVWSLGARYIAEGHNLTMLFWYAVRIIILISIILAFMMITLRRFLDKKIITPLEVISHANRRFMDNESQGREVSLDDDTPSEIQEIATTRSRMLDSILKVSAERLHLANFIRDTFGQYMSKKVVDEILESPKGRQIGGRREIVTVLMSDLRGFTGLSETRKPEELVRLLNLYLDRMSAVIHAYEGTIDDFIGDAIVVIFGAPEKHKDDPARAVACGLAMQKALYQFNRENATEGVPPFEMGIGIETGPVVMGNIGSESRMKYSIIGATVNVAARLESQTTGGQVVAGESTYQIVKDIVKTDPAASVMMKGLRKPLIYYPVTSIGTPYDLSIDDLYRPEDQTRIRVTFQCWTIVDKVVNREAIRGETLSINETHITAKMPKRLDPLIDIKLTFDFCTEVHCFKDMYAKVISVQNMPQGIIHDFRITYLDPEDREIIANLTRTPEPNQVSEEN